MDASARKAKKPTTSVTVVTNTVEETAGSKPMRLSAERNEDAGKRRRQQIDDHRRADDESEPDWSRTRQWRSPDDEREGERR